MLQPSTGLFGAAEMQWFFITKAFFLAGYFRDYTLATNMGYPTMTFFAGHSCGGVVFFWPRWPRTFLPGRMGGSLVLGLTAISVLGFIDSFQNFL